MTQQERVERVMVNHMHIVKEARRKHEAGLSLNGSERYIIKNNVGYNPLLGG